MNFGDKFLSALKAIYQQQSAQIIINGGLTDIFKIGKGTRQGCPLSPLLFVLTMEILLIKIRDSSRLKGIKISKIDYRLRAFADGLVVTLSHPTDSVKELVEILVQYGQVSGFKVNKNKTKILLKNMSRKGKDFIAETTGYEIVNKVKYLGVYITTSNVKLYKNNYERLWVKVQKDLNDWQKLQLSLLGRISVVKMNVLPKFLFFVSDDTHFKEGC